MLCLLFVKLHTDPITTFKADCDDGDIRLNNGSNELEGRVEVCFNNAWGSVCGNDFGDGEAQVVCNYVSRKMGYLYNNSIPFRNAEFGEGSGPIFIQTLGCTGTEHQLVGPLGCQLGSPVGVHSCDHSRDAGVICTGKKVFYELLQNDKVLVPYRC